MTQELPKQELLIKLMGMSGSSNDGEALNAVRLANKLLSDNKWSWEKLIHGKIKVVEDPFKNIRPDDLRARDTSVTPHAPPRPQPQAARPYTPPPRPATPPPQPRYDPYAARNRSVPPVRPTARQKKSQPELWEL